MILPVISFELAVVLLVSNFLEKLFGAQYSKNGHPDCLKNNSFEILKDFLKGLILNVSFKVYRKRYDQWNLTVTIKNSKIGIPVK